MDCHHKFPSIKTRVSDLPNLNPPGGALENLLPSSRRGTQDALEERDPRNHPGLVRVAYNIGHIRSVIGCKPPPQLAIDNAYRG